jgi:hypothetical protein
MMKRKWIARTLMILCLFVLSSVPWEHTLVGQSIQSIPNACAVDGSCCKNPNAICGLNGQNFVGFDYHPGPCGGPILI